MVKWGSSGGIVDKSKIKPSRESFKSCSFRSYVKGLRWLCPSSFNAAPCFSLLSLYAALPDRHPASPTSWHLQRNPGFSFTVSHIVFWDLRGVLACPTPGLGGGRLHNPFTFVSFLTLKPEACGQHCQDLLPLELQLKQHSVTATISKKKIP